MRHVIVALLVICVPVACGGSKSPTAPTTTSQNYTLSVVSSPSAGGSVTTNPNQTQFSSGASVTLTANPASGYQFARWEGDASGTNNPTSLVLNANKSVTAVFTQTTAAQHALTVTASPSNGGSVTKSPDQAQYDAGTTVTLAANAASGYQFVRWEGDVTGSTNPTSVTMDRSKTVTAVFTQSTAPQYALTVFPSPSNGGSVTKSPDQGQYASGTTVIVTAAPASGYLFVRWEGDATGSANPTSVTMDRNKTVTAVFVLGAPTQYSLVVNASPSNGGSVTKSPSQAQYDPGVTVTLTAVPGSGYRFDHWEGDAAGSANPTSVTMNGNKMVTAVFTASTYTITIASSPSNGGSVTKSPDQAQYNAGTTVTLTAVPATNYVFDHWEGGVTGSANPAAVTMDGNKTVTAVFTPLPQCTLSLISSPTNGGSVTFSPSPLVCGNTLTITALPASAYDFDHWGGDLGGSVNPTTLLALGAKSVTAYFTLKPPVVSGPSSVRAGTFTVSVRYDYWLSMAFITDHIELERSTTSPTSGFSVVQSSPGGSHTNPYDFTVTELTAGTRYYRARVFTGASASVTPYSNVVTVVVQ